MFPRVFTHCVDDFQKCILRLTAYDFYSKDKKMNGFVPNELLIFTSNHSTGDYDGNMTFENYRCQIRKLLHNVSSCSVVVGLYCALP